MGARRAPLIIADERPAAAAPLRPAPVDPSTEFTPLAPLTPRSHFYTPPVFELTVETVFSAAHSLVIAGVPEPLHGHDWHVTAAITGPVLDPDGMLLDFHAVERTLNRIIAPFRNANLNQTPPFDHLNPSAEHVARFLARSLEEGLAGLAAGEASAEPTTMDHRPRVAWVRVTEAPGCAVRWGRDLHGPAQPLR